MTTAHRSQNQAPQPFNPNLHTSESHNDRWVTPKKAIAMGGAAIAIGGALFVHKSMNDATNERLNQITNPDNYTSAPVTPGQVDNETHQTIKPTDAMVVKYDLNNNDLLDREERDKMSPTDYETLDESTRASDRAERFNTYLRTGWDTIQSHLTDQERSILYMPDLSKPRAEWTDQDYLNYETLAVWLVTTQGTSQEAQDEGLRALSVVARPDTNMYESTVKWIQQHPDQGMKAVYMAIPTVVSNKELSNIIVDEFEIDSNGGRLVGYKSLTDGSENYTLFANRSDDEGYVIPISQHVYDTLSDPKLTNLLERYSA